MKHPHGRGEDWICSESNRCTEETPPRAWGRQMIEKLIETNDGNTPTGVGKTSACTYAAASFWKHPHGRGEDHLPLAQSQSALETPPRAWGRPIYPIFHSYIDRNTPTGVGKTATLSMGQMGHRKHPHGRGEDILIKSTYADNPETPPRAWGRQSLFIHFLVKLGNTPTGVGKTKARGVWLREWRNTPTGVGKTPVPLATGMPLQKHPHGRGEDTVQFGETFDNGETPPRAWGRHRNR